MARRLSERETRRRYALYRKARQQYGRDCGLDDSHPYYLMGDHDQPSLAVIRDSVGELDRPVDLTVWSQDAKLVVSIVIVLLQPVTPHRPDEGATLETGKLCRYDWPDWRGEGLILNDSSSDRQIVNRVRFVLEMDSQDQSYVDYGVLQFVEHQPRGYKYF